MTAEFRSGVRYRMPAVFGPAPGPRQKADGTPWRPEETGTMSCQWLTVSYLTQRSKLERLLPPGCELRGEPVVSVSLSYFSNLYWLAGRGYGILYVDVPVTYTGRTETIVGAFCPVLWEGSPDACITGRDELGFAKLFADIPKLTRDPALGTAGGEASWMGHKFFEIEARGLMEVGGEKRLPGSDGAAIHYKYMPRTSSGGGEGPDVAYVTTSLSLPGVNGSDSPIKFEDSNFRKWKGSGTLQFHRATFEQLPTSFHVVNGMADLDIVEYVGAELVEFSAPGIAISANAFRAVEPAT
jgi:Acetoacetate decarboxylase (ADC)